MEPVVWSKTIYIPSLIDRGEWQIPYEYMLVQHLDASVDRDVNVRLHEHVPTPLPGRQQLPFRTAKGWYVRTAWQGGSCRRILRRKMRAASIYNVDVDVVLRRCIGWANRANITS